MNSPAAPTDFLRVFAEHAGPSGILRYDRFVDLALFDPTVGYYRSDRTRVGYGPETDFFTSTTSGEVFGELIVASCVNLLGERTARDCTFIEIGAETESGVLTGVAHPFRSVRTIRLGTELKLEGLAIVFSNELFDAQPFRRFRFLGGIWHELGVILRDGALSETLLPSSEPPDIGLPASTADGYTVDAPLAAAQLVDVIARMPWTGLFLGIDYGKSWDELVHATPAGTARAYYRHTQNNDLLARPGEQDLTCHVCWDWLSDSLLRNRFTDSQLNTQESFFIHHAESFIAPAIQQDAAKLTRRKQSLFQLLHGAHLGQKFQVLHAIRR